MKVALRICLLVVLLSLGVVQVAAQDPVEVTVWAVQFSDSVLQTWETVMADFETANPGITITLETRAVDAHKDAMRVAAGTDAQPDIYFMWAGLGLGGEFVNLGVSEPLDEVYTSMGWDERYLGSALTKTQYNGEMHGVPYTNHGMVVYYRKDLFEQAGITDEPATYDELIAANQKLLDAGITPFAFGGSVNWHLMRLLDSLLETKCGAETHDGLKSMTLSWTEEPCATEAFTELARWRSDGYLGEDFLGIDPQASNLLVYLGQAAMMLEGDWMVNLMLDEGEDLANYGMFPFPTGTDRLYYFAEMLYVTKGGPHEAEALRFLDYLTSDEVQEQQLGNFGAISVNKNISYGTERRPLDAEWSELFDTLTEVYEPGDQAFPLDVNTESWRIQNGVLTGDITPEDAAAQLQTFIDNKMAAS